MQNLKNKKLLTKTKMENQENPRKSTEEKDSNIVKVPASLNKLIQKEIGNKESMNVYYKEGIMNIKKEGQKGNYIIKLKGKNDLKNNVVTLELKLGKVVNCIHEKSGKKEYIKYPKSIERAMLHVYEILKEKENR